MGQNKLDTQIKEQLNSREIQPSAQAWDRLDAMLSVAEEKKTKRPFGFWFIAASITVLLTAGIFFFSQESKKIATQDNVVETETKDTIQKSVNEIATPIKEESQVAVSENEQSIINNQRVSINNQSIINQNQKSNNPLINRDKKIEFQNSSDVALKDLPKIQTGNQIIVGKNEIPSNVSGKKSMTDEQLLASLDNLAKQSTNKQDVIKVDAKSLLSQLDGELELTFREKVINKVSKNYKEVKVALSNRNQE